MQHHLDEVRSAAREGGGLAAAPGGRATDRDRDGDAGTSQERLKTSGVHFRASCRFSVQACEKSGWRSHSLLLESQPIRDKVVLFAYIPQPPHPEPERSSHAWGHGSTTASLGSLEFFSRTLMDSCLLFIIFIYLIFHPFFKFCVWYRKVVQLHSSACGCAIFTTPFIEETISFFH